MIDDGKRRKRRRWQRKTRAMSTGNRKAQPWRQKYQGTALIARWTKHGFDCKLMVARPRNSTWTGAQHGLDRYVVPEVLRSPQSFAEQHAVSVMVNSGKRNSKGYSPGLKIDVADDITVVLSLCTASWKLLQHGENADIACLALTAVTTSKHPRCTMSVLCTCAGEEWDFP